MVVVYAELIPLVILQECDEVLSIRTKATKNLGLGETWRRQGKLFISHLLYR